jgi:hypothetical protein
VAGCCECGDEPSGSCATELVSSESCSFLKQKESLLGIWVLLPNNSSVMLQLSKRLRFLLFEFPATIANTVQAISQGVE